MSMCHKKKHEKTLKVTEQRMEKWKRKAQISQVLQQTKLITKAILNWSILESPMIMPVFWDE